MPGADPKVTRRVTAELADHLARGGGQPVHLQVREQVNVRRAGREQCEALSLKTNVLMPDAYGCSRRGALAASTNACIPADQPPGELTASRIPSQPSP